MTGVTGPLALKQRENLGIPTGCVFSVVLPASELAGCFQIPPGTKIENLLIDKCSTMVLNIVRPVCFHL
jgi:hypothetical protein